jgi:hypothetical protein
MGGFRTGSRRIAAKTEGEGAPFIRPLAFQAELRVPRSGSPQRAAAGPCVGGRYPGGSAVARGSAVTLRPGHKRLRRCCAPNLPPQDVPPPAWVEPEPVYVADFVPWEFKDTVPHPSLPAPPAQLVGVPQYGFDWTGRRPFQQLAGHWEPKPKRSVVRAVSSKPSRMPKRPELMPVSDSSAPRRVVCRPSL